MLSSILGTDGRLRRPAGATLCAAAVLSLAIDASAQPDAARRADALFAEGKASLEARDFAHACPKLEESYGLDPADGTLLALAICHEGVGRMATAWREFQAVADAATRDRRTDRARFSRDEIAKLEPKLPRLTIVVSVAPAGLEVDVDGTRIAQAEWGKAAPIDAGHHTVAARAPGYKPWTAGVDIGPEHDARSVDVGPLVRETPETPVTEGAPPIAPLVHDAAATPPSSPDDWRRPTGWIVGGAGGVAVGVGAYFGLRAISQSSDAKSRCSPSLCTDAAAVQENGDAKSAATASNVTIGAGAVLLAAGVYFLLTSRTSTPVAFRFAPLVGRQQIGAGFDAAW